jgi:phosphatidylserine decarboxylase
MLRQYDTDDNGAVNRIELTTMLDTLGSTLSAQTIDKFFERFHQRGAGGHKDLAELTMDQAVICLEDQLSALSKKPVGEPSESFSSMPRIAIHGSKDTSEETDDKSQYSVNTSNGSEGQPYLAGSRNQSSVSVLTQPILGPAGEEGATLDDHGLEEGDKTEEHVIQISECPLCHQPRLNKRSEMDIVTHLATCASQDWRQVDKLVMGGFVTSSQAQRKWYSKVISKISYGGYKLGANSANILVQDRVTGLVQEERMSVYVRLGIRLLYKGLSSSSMENKKSMRINQSSTKNDLLMLGSPKTPVLFEC